MISEKIKEIITLKLLSSCNCSQNKEENRTFDIQSNKHKAKDLNIQSENKIKEITE